MHKLIINKLGPVEKYELECSQFMTFTGFQASGKSTIAKAIYYFRTIKEDILELAKSQALDTKSELIADDDLYSGCGTDLNKALENYLREKFMRTFGSSWGMAKEMCMEYYFTEYRIVANKCKTQEIHSSAYRKYQIRWKNKLLQKTGFIEEKI